MKMCSTNINVHICIEHISVEQSFEKNRKTTMFFLKKNFLFISVKTMMRNYYNKILFYSVKAHSA